MLLARRSLSSTADCAQHDANHLGVHRGEVLDGGVERVGRSRVSDLLALYGGLHDGVVRDEGLLVLAGVLEELRLDALRQHVVGDGGDGAARVLLLGHHPAGRLHVHVHVRRCGFAGLHLSGAQAADALQRVCPVSR